MKNNKKFGGTIKHWQIHHLSVSKETIDKAYPEQGGLPMVFTGSVVKDPTGRRAPNDHMRSSLITSINKKRTEIETLNSIYKMEAESEGKDLFGDLGDGVMAIFY